MRAVRKAVRFPPIPSLPLASYMPGVWRMDYGQEYAPARVITREPPALGAPYVVLVPQVDADGNDAGGIAMPEVAVPLGTHTGWSVSTFPLTGRRYLAGLVGPFQPFARTRAEREQPGDARPSIGERYRGRQDYLERVTSAAGNLVQQRLVLPGDVEGIVPRAGQAWDAVVGR